MIGTEYEYEPVRGLPGHLPAGERMLWQGAPDWWALARSIFHIRFVAAYFMALMLWNGFAGLRDGGLLAGIRSAAWVAPVGLAALVIFCLLAYAIARTTVYTITDKRVVLRFGIAVPMAVNLPLSAIESVGLRVQPDGSGNLALDIGARPQLGYFMMWPHARPYWLSRTQPMLRGVADAKRIAEILGEALARTVTQDVEMVAPPQMAGDVPAPRTRKATGGMSGGVALGGAVATQQRA